MHFLVLKSPQFDYLLFILTSMLMTDILGLEKVNKFQAQRIYFSLLLISNKNKCIG